MEKSKPRLQYVDALKCLAIFLVTWGHSILSLSGRDALESGAYVFINSFHMPLFMLMVGFFSASSLRKSPKEFVGDKFRALILPTFVWVIVFWVINAYTFQVWRYNGSEGLIRNLVGSFWFLKSAFFCYLLYYFFSRPLLGRRHGFWIAGIATLVLSQVFPIFRVNLMYPCFFAGAVIARYIGGISRHWIWITATSSIVFVASYLLLYDGGMGTMMPAVKERLLAGDLQAVADLVYLQAVQLLTGISASVALFSLFYGLMHNYSGGSLWNYVKRCGRTTFSIYILQIYLLEIIMGKYLKFGNVDATLFDLLVAPVISILVMIVCEQISRMIETNGWTAFLLLGKKRPGRKQIA